MRPTLIPQTELHRFCGQGYDRFGRVVCPSHEASRSREPMTETRPSVDTGEWLPVAEKSELPLVAERDEPPSRLERGHTSPDLHPAGHRLGAALS
jgi:hypothetical protein